MSFPSRSSQIWGAGLNNRVRIRTPDLGNGLPSNLLCTSKFEGLVVLFIYKTNGESRQQRRMPLILVLRKQTSVSRRSRPA